jgi:tetratricopeptide (TPR) repeat protein
MSDKATELSSQAVMDLLSEIWLRIAAGSEGDKAAVLDDSALVEATRLVRLSTDLSGQIPVEVAYAIASLRAVRFLLSSDDEDRLTAIRLLTEIMTVAPELAPQELLSVLGAGIDDGLALIGADLLEQARTATDRALLDQAVDTLDKAVLATPADDDDRAARLSNLGLALRIRSERYGDNHDLERAVTAGVASVTTASANSPELPGSVANFADTLLSRFERSGDPRDLEQAVAMLRATIEEMDPDHSLHPVIADKLGAALTDRFAVFGRHEDLDTAVELCRAASVVLTDDSPFLAGCQTNLGSALAIRFAQTIAPEDIEDAVTACRDALDATLPNDPAAAGRWSNLSAALQTRYLLRGARDDLDGAVAAARSALNVAVAAKESDNYLAMYFSNSSNILRTRGDLDRDRDDLDAAVDTARRAAALSPAGHPTRAGRLNNLGLALLSRFEQDNRSKRLTRNSATAADLTEGIAALNEITSSSTNKSDRADCLSTLSLLLRTRFEHDNEPADLEAAVRAAITAVETYPSEHLHRAGALLNLGTAHATAFRHTSRDTDFRQAIEAWRSGSVAIGSPADIRLACARQWAELAAAERRWNVAAEGYTCATALLPLAAWRGLWRMDQESALARQAPVATEAAAAALAASEPASAVGCLEQGRSVLWAQLLEIRDNLEPLRQRLPELFGALNRVRRALDLSLITCGVPKVGHRR